MATALVTVFILTLVVSVTLGQEYVRGSPAKNFRRQISRALLACGEGDKDKEFSECTPDCKAEGFKNHMDCSCKKLPGPGYGPICHSDCYTILTCMGASTAAIYQNCADIDPKKPYCQGNACTATKPSDEGICRKPPVEFTCTANGQYPNPENCQEYFLCVGGSATIAGSAVRYECPINYVYDSKTGLCKAKKTATDCQTIKCVKGAAPYQVFAADKSILIFCNPTDQSIVLFRCGAENMEYNPETLQCDFVCPAEGRFPVAGQDDYFYECYRDGTKLSYVKQKCPNGYEFCKDNQQCKVTC